MAQYLEDGAKVKKFLPLGGLLNHGRYILSIWSLPQKIWEITFLRSYPILNFSTQSEKVKVPSEIKPPLPFL